MAEQGGRHGPQSDSTPPVSLTVFFPCYNEQDNVANVVRQAVEVLEGLRADYEVLIVNDGSADETGRVADQIAATNERIRVIHHPRNLGYGAALQSGFRAATRDLVFYTDGDGQFDMKEMPLLLPLMAEYDIVSGYRMNRQDPPLRRLNGWLWTRMNDFLFSLDLRDLDCAFKLFKRAIFDHIKMESQGALIATEILARAARKGYKITEKGVHHYPRTAGKPTGGNPRVILRAFKEVIRLRGRILSDRQRHCSRFHLGTTPTMHNEKVNLFVYGSLRDSRIFQSVSGYAFTRSPSRLDDKTLFAELAFLPHHRRVSPDNVYYYAVPSETARIEGFIIHDVPMTAMTEIDRYEGKRYRRETVQVHTGHGVEEALAYLVTIESMRKQFGDRFHVNLIHELWLRKRIQQFLKKHTRPGDRTVDAELERQAERELLAATERDLVMAHYRRDAVSDYYLERELDRPRPSIRPLYSEPQAQPYIRNYLALVIRQVLLNQFEEQMEGRFRYELEHMRTSLRYFARTVSLFACLQILNANNRVVEPIIQKCLDAMPHQQNDLIDYVKYAVGVVKSIFDPRMAEDYLSRIRSNLQPGLVPLGCELELSNLGAAAVEPLRSASNAKDAVYDGFRYFYDFRLDVLCWKLGGYIDDHSGYNDRPRRQGFFEIAPGRLSVAGELSRPATADPWVLSRLIHELIVFFQIRPHSLHLSFQMRKRQIGRQRVLPLGFVQCLLALGGGLERWPGGMWISRLCKEEIIQHTYGEEFVFARTSRRNWYLGGDEIADKPPAQAMTCIQQYKFIRLDKQMDYEPLILGLKGLQLEYNPGDYLTADQMKAAPRLARRYQELKEWAHQPSEISGRTIQRFLDTIHRGLMKERHHQPAHRLHYIDYAVSAIEAQLKRFNEQVKEASPDPVVY